MSAADAIIVVVNAASGLGHGEGETARLRALFAAEGVEATVERARDGAEITALASQALDKAPRAIVAAGGDGTVSAVASGLAGSGIPMGVLPLGTLNHFARDLGIPLELEQAVRNVVKGAAVPVDVGEVNGRVFVNNSSLGLYPYMVLYREKQRRRLGRGKWHAMFWAAMTVLKRYPFLDVRLALKGVTALRRTPLVFIGNNEYAMDGFNMGTRSRLDEGVLDLYMLRPISRLGLAGLALRALFGRLHQAEDFEMHKVDRVRIEPRKRRRHELVATDGEITLMEMPLQYRIRRAALEVIVPTDLGT